MEKERTIMVTPIINRKRGTEFANIEFLQFEDHSYYRIKSPKFDTIDEAIDHSCNLLLGSDYSYSLTHLQNLRDCPHCKDQPLLFRIYNEKKMDEWYIQCTNPECGYGGGVYPTIQEAIDNWNNW